jgi:hypothetical protein
MPSLSERAEAAQAFVPERERALVDDPEILRVRRVALALRARGLDDAPLPEGPRPSGADPRARAVRRMASSAAADNGYRVQLVDLAALHAGLYLEAVHALYAIEARTLGRFEALARAILDQRQLLQARQGQEEITLLGVTGDDA